MKRQESSISSNKNRGLKYALCIITLLCCLLSTTIHAEEIIIGAENVASISMYGYDETLTTQSWKNFPFEIIDNNVIKTNNVVYGQFRQMIEINYNTIKTNTIQIKFDLIAKFYTSGQYVDLTQNGTPKIELYSPYKSFNMEYKNINTKKISYSITKDNINQNTNKIDIYTNVTIVGANLYIENLSVIINGEEYKIIKAWEDKQQELEEALQEIEVTVDQNAIDDIINNPPTIESTINVGIFNFTNETIPLYIMTLTLSLAIISFLLYGKK